MDNLKHPRDASKGRAYTFQSDGERFLFDARGCRVFEYHPLLVDILSLAGLFPPEGLFQKLSGRYSREAIAAAWKSLGGGSSSSSSPGRGKDTGGEKTPRGFKEMYLQVSHHCNLSCTYCYADGGNFGGPGRMMNRQTAQKAVDFFLAGAGPGNPLIINFDGGEPLLNLSLVRSTVAHAEAGAAALGRTVRFNIATNGTLLSRETVTFLAEKDFGIGISIDGDRETHDRARKFRDGTGSFDTLAARLQGDYLTRYPRMLQARATVTRNSLNCEDSVHFLLNLGFKHIYLEPAAGNGQPWVVGKEDLPALEKEFSRIADFYREQLLAQNFFILRNFFFTLKKIHKKSPCSRRCNAGISTIAVSPGGEIYPCYKFVGRDEFTMGNVHEGSCSQSLVSRFENNRVENKPGCKDCWARHLCGGGCPYLSVLSRDDIRQRDEVDCRFTRHLAKLCLEMYTSVHRQNKTTWTTLFG